MSDKHVEFTVCPVCGSTECLLDYPAVGSSTCLKCGHETVTFVLRVVQEDAWEKLFGAGYVCPSCDGKDESDKFFYEDNDVVISKCEACGKLEGFRVLPMTGLGSEWLKDGDFEEKSVIRAKKEGQPILSAPVSKRLAKTLKHQEKDPVTVCQRRFSALLKEKSRNLASLGVDAKVVEHAKLRASAFIDLKGPFTGKQLEFLLSACIESGQDDLLRTGKISRRVSERQLSKVFNANRVTMHKWKKMLDEKRKP
jgi:hypothetical protein